MMMSYVWSDILDRELCWYALEMRVLERRKERDPVCASGKKREARFEAQKSSHQGLPAHTLTQPVYMLPVALRKSHLRYRAH